MSWAHSLIGWIKTPRALRLAQQKRRLQRIAFECGCSVSQSKKIAALFFKNDLGKRP